MKPLLLMLALIANPAFADMYKWVDAAGTVHYSDRVPPTHAATASKIVLPPASGPVAQSNPHNALPGRWTQSQGSADYLEMVFTPSGQLAARGKKNDDRLEFAGQWQSNGRDLEMLIADGTISNDLRGVQLISNQRKLSQILEMSDSTLVLRDAKDGSVSRFSKSR